MKIMIVLAVGMFVAACGLTPQGNFFREAVKSMGAKVSTEGLKNAEYIICQATPIGAVRERYKGRAEVYRQLCNGDEIGLLD